LPATNVRFAKCGASELGIGERLDQLVGRMLLERAEIRFGLREISTELPCSPVLRLVQRKIIKIQQ